MKISRLFILLILFFVSVINAQSIPDDIKYLDSASIYKQDIEKYKGVQYLFHSFIKYDNEAYPPPFPYKDGRVRDGKYKASETALDAYIKGLSKYNNKSFTLAHVDYSANNVKGIVMACENGDSLYVGISTIRQFINKEYFDGIKKLKGTKTIYQVPHSNYLAIFEGKCPQNNCTDEEIFFPKQYPYFVGFTDVKTKKTSFYLPYLSTWKIMDVVFDTTFVGAQTSFSNRANLFFERVRYTVKNEKYGEYYYFENNLDKITKRNETIGKRDNCDEPIRDEYGRWSQYCSGKYRYWNDQAIFSPTILIPFEDCPHYTYHGLCFDSTAYLLQDWKNEYTDNEIKIINEWAAKGFVEAIWTNAVILGDLTEAQLEKCFQEGYPPLLAFFDRFVRDNNSLEPLDNFFEETHRSSISLKFFSENGSNIQPYWLDQIFDGMKKAYTIYGKQLALDILFDQAKIYTSMDLDDIYKKAIKIGYSSVRAKEIINAYYNWKKENEARLKKDFIIADFGNSFTPKYIQDATFNEILRSFQEFQEEHKLKPDDLKDLLWSIISRRSAKLNHVQENNAKDNLTLYDSLLSLYTQAASFGYKDTSTISHLEENIARLHLIIQLETDIEKGAVPEEIFTQIQQKSPELFNETVILMFEKAISGIIDKQKKKSKNQWSEITELEKEIELFRLATKYGYKDGLDSIDAKQKKLDYLRKKKSLK